MRRPQVITDAFEIPLAGSCHEVAPFQYDEAKGKMGDEFYYFYGTDGGYEGLSAELKRTRPEGNFCGWYHSHPFEPVPGGDHCWFSGIDVTTQVPPTASDRARTTFHGLSCCWHDPLWCGIFADAAAAGLREGRRALRRHRRGPAGDDAIIMSSCHRHYHLI